MYQLPLFYSCPAEVTAAVQEFENDKPKVNTDCKIVSNGEHREWTGDRWQYIDKKGGKITVAPPGNVL